MSDRAYLRCQTHQVNAHDFGSDWGPEPFLRLLQNLEHVQALHDADPEFYVGHTAFEYGRGTTGWIAEWLQLHRNCNLAVEHAGRYYRKDEASPCKEKREGVPILSNFEGL